MAKTDLWASVPGDLYAVLGVAPDADDGHIQAAWHRAARATHPDVGGDRDRFRSVHVAYLVLSDPEQRRRYDTERAIRAAAARAEARMASQGEGIRSPRADASEIGHGLLVVMALLAVAAVVLAYVLPWTTLVTGTVVAAVVLTRYARLHGYWP